jgi:hypothetical protein
MLIPEFAVSFINGGSTFLQKTKGVFQAQEHRAPASSLAFFDGDEQDGRGWEKDRTRVVGSSAAR